MHFELIEKQVIYDGKKIRLELHHLRDEETGKRHVREICVHPGAVVVLGLLEDQKIVLVRNRRPAVAQILIELPAGTLEKGESPMNCAGRELQEETGYLAGRIQVLGTFFTSPGILSEKMHAFVAYDLQKSQQALDVGEEIEVMTATLEESLEMIRDGRIADGKTIATLLMYDKFGKTRNVNT